MTRAEINDGLRKMAADIVRATSDAEGVVESSDVCVGWFAQESSCAAAKGAARYYARLASDLSAEVARVVALPDAQLVDRDVVRLRERFALIREAAASLDEATTVEVSAVDVLEAFSSEYARLTGELARIVAEHVSNVAAAGLSGVLQGLGPFGLLSLGLLVYGVWTLKVRA